jgi:hypothetical protein
MDEDSVIAGVFMDITRIVHREIQVTYVTFHISQAYWVGTEEFKSFSCYPKILADQFSKARHIPM